MSPIEESAVTHPGQPPKLSIVIRCRNEARTLTEAMTALRAQRCSFAYEIVVVDNESTDETRNVCEQFGATVVPIARAEFTYGRALNVGISHARGELILLLSAHALPVGSHFLEGTVAPFADPQMGAVRCLFLGNAKQIREWYTPKDIQYGSEDEQRAAEASPGWVADYPAATCAALRRSVWKQIQFDEVLEASEDKFWASKVLAAGFKIRRCAEAVWMYTRQHTEAERRRRANREHLAVYRMTRRPPLTWPSFVYLTVRALLASPFVAIRYLVGNVRWYAMLVTIPLRSRFAAKRGSVRDFDRHP